METQCTDCGTPNYEGARYCRKCGKTLIDFAVSEATTRNFENGARAVHPFAEPGGMPQYVPPSDATPPGGLASQTGFRPAVGTNPLDAKKPPMWPFWTVLAVAIVVILAVGAAWLAVVRTPVTSQPQAPAAETPRADRPVLAPAEPEPDAENLTPPEEPGDADPLLAQVPDRAKQWIYPGAQAEEIHELPGGQVALDLTTEDDFAKVVNYYRTKMPNAIKNTSREEANFVGDEAIVNIGGGGGDTTIQILVHPPGGGGFVPPIPPVPRIAPPPPPPPPAAPRSQD